MSEKIYTPADVQTALKERLKKFEIQMKDLHTRELRKDQHQEPGVHEAAGAEAPHTEPGGHENAVMPMPQSPAEQPVGSSHGIPQGQLQDLCPMCGQPDMPGQCTCLNGGGHEAMDPSIIDPAAHGVPTTPLALNETQGYGPGTVPLAQNEECAHGGDCKDCKPMKKDADFIDIKGKQKSVGVIGTMPDDKKSKEMSAGGSGGEVKKGKGLNKSYVSPSLKHGTSKPVGQTPAPKPVSDADHAADKKAAGLGKAGPPMAKPPSGGPAGAVAPAPVAAAKAPKVAGPAGGPKALGKAALPMAGAAGMAAVHAAVDSFKAQGVAPKAAAPKPMPTAGAHAGRAASFGSAMAGDFQPKGPINSGLELAGPPKKMAAPGRLAAPGVAKSLSKSMGVCLFCGNGEHAGSCGLAKNIQSSLIKVASPIFSAVPKLKPAGVGHPGHISRATQETTTVNAPAGDATKATPIRAIKSEEKAKPTHVCAAPLCTKGISGGAEYCKAHQPPKGK